MLLWSSFLITFSALFPLINPVGTALVFVGLIGDEPPQVYHSLARKIAINNVVFLAVIELLGAAILNFFGISLPIVQISGGLVTASIGWTMLHETNEQASSKESSAEMAEAEDRSAQSFEQKAFYPYTFPVTSGPGTLVVLLTLSAHVSTHNLKRNIAGHAGVFLACVLLSGLVYLCYASAPRITASISRGTAQGIQRVMAFILLCIGVQITWNGLAILLRSFFH